MQRSMQTKRAVASIAQKTLVKHGNELPANGEFGRAVATSLKSTWILLIKTSSTVPLSRFINQQMADELSSALKAHQAGMITTRCGSIRITRRLSLSRSEEHTSELQSL